MSQTKKNLSPLPCQARWRSDYLLVQQYLAGDSSAWHSLYQQAYPIALRFLSQHYTMRYLSVSDMADILSEAFLRCQLRAHRFQGRSSFPTYVCGFVRYIALAEVKKQIDQDRRIVALSYLYRTKNSASNPEDILIRRERDHFLWTAYYSLPLYHQILFGYLVLDRNTYQEARRVTGLLLKSHTARKTGTIPSRP